MRKSFTAGMAFLLLVWAAVCSCRVGAEEKNLTVFHINDVHGRLDTFPKAAFLLEQERKKSPDILFLNAGDNFSGNPVVDQYEPRGLPIMETLNQLGLDMMALGNHDFDYGQETLGQFMKQSRFPFLCANLTIKEGNFPSPVPFVLRTMKNGLRVAVLGLIWIDPVTGLPESHPDRLKGLQFSNPLIRGAEFRYLRKQCDVFIALTHLGLEDDVKLAESMPELDLIVGGHSHTIIRSPKETNGVLIVQTGGNMYSIGRVDLRWQDGRVVEKRGSLIDLAPLQGEDLSLKERIVQYGKNPKLTKKVGFLSAPLEGKGPLGSLMADAIREALSLDFVFQNNGGIRVNTLNGEIQVKDIYRLDPFGNDTVIMQLTPAEIRGLIAHSFDRRSEIDLQVSGMEYEVIRGNDGKAKEICMRRTSGEAWDEKKMYRVGLSSYVASTYRFEHKDAGASGRTTCVEALLAFLQKGVDLERYRGMVRARVGLNP